MLTRAERKQMARYLDAAECHDEVMTVDMACGFLYGITITPVVSSPLDWIPKFFGGEFPELEEHELLKLVSFFSDIFNRLLKKFHAGALEFPWDYKGMELETIDRIHDWVYGLDLALQANYDVWLQEDDPFIHNEEIDDVSLSLFYVHSLADPEAVEKSIVEGDTFDPFDEKTIVNLFSAMPSAVSTLTAFGREQDRLRMDAMQSTGPSTLKVGRNASCPCGSGKKYKKCCGRSDELWN
jgi:uncharacterized protein